MRGLVKFGFGSASLGLVALVLAATLTSTAVAQTETTLGIDVDPTGNSATLLGNRDQCAEVSSGDTFQVDVVVQDATALSAWEAYLSLDTKVVNVVDRDVQLLLSSAEGANAFDVSESVPEDQSDNGLYRVGAAAIGGEKPVGVDGSGVLARLTLKAVGSGITTLSVKPHDTTTTEPVGPTLSNKDGDKIGDDNQDGFFDGPILDAQVAVDQACPGGDGVSPAGLGGGGGGLAWWVFAAIAAAIAAAAVIGGVAFITLRRQGSHPAA
jgi:hypothetical protein